MADQPFRLCVDLNVWVNNFLALAKNRRETAAQFIVEAIQDGRSGVGPIQLVVSHAMLTRLMTVLTRMGASEDSAAQFAQLINNISLLGPQQEFPHVVLGGGVLPTRDAKMPVYNPYDPASTPPFYDPEDGRVLDTAIAGRADALTTANFRDFVDPHDTIVIRGRVHVRHTAERALYIVQPQEMAEWLRSGRRPTPARSSEDDNKDDVAGYDPFSKK